MSSVRERPSTLTAQLVRLMRAIEGLHDALGRYHASGSVSEEDTRLALEVLRSYGSLRAETDVMRCKVYSSLLPAYKLLGEEDEFVRLLATMRSMLPAVKASSLALRSTITRAVSVPTV